MSSGCRRDCTGTMVHGPRFHEPVRGVGAYMMVIRSDDSERKVQERRSGGPAGGIDGTELPGAKGFANMRC